MTAASRKLSTAVQAVMRSLLSSDCSSLKSFPTPPGSPMLFPTPPSGRGPFASPSNHSFSSLILPPRATAVGGGARCAGIGLVRARLKYSRSHGWMSLSSSPCSENCSLNVSPERARARRRA